MDAQEWIKLETTIRKSKKQYVHFDYRTDIAQCSNYILKSKNIETHGFYPFIHFIKTMVKYNSKNGKKPKTRDICYAAHIDRCIYQYYCFVLSEIYNARVAREKISPVAVAYRTDLHKTNINFAKQAFDFIKRNTSCYVMIGDFTHFFDNLDHAYLKERWCDLLGAQSLPTDQYKVFKSVTQFSTWELTDLLKLNGLEDNSSGRHALNSLARVLTPEQFKKFRSHIKKNSNPYGIPQGSPISALLANVYMLDIDKQINDAVRSLNGMYMRYSDDFIIIIPKQKEYEIAEKLANIVKLFNQTPGLTLEPEKTQYFFYTNSNLINCGNIF